MTGHIFRDIGQHWLAHQQERADAGLVMPTSVHKYGKIIERLDPYLGDVSLPDFNRLVAEKFVANRRRKGVSATTINHELIVVRAVLAHAVELCVIQQAPKIKALPTASHHKEVPDLNMVYSFLVRLPERHRLPFEFSMHTGMSWHEVCQLRWGDLNANRTSAAVGQRDGYTTKTAARVRTVPINKPGRDVLKQAKGNHKPDLDELVFPAAVSTRQAMARERRRCDPHVTPGTARKIFATTAAENDMPQHQLQQVLGHAPGSRMTAKHYVGANHRKLEKSVDLVGQKLS